MQKDCRRPNAGYIVDNPQGSAERPSALSLGVTATIQGRAHILSAKRKDALLWDGVYIRPMSVTSTTRSKDANRGSYYSRILRNQRWMSHLLEDQYLHTSMSSFSP